jgi:hypothetical protein
MPHTIDPKNAKADPELQNEGEGSRSGARRYDKGAEEAAKNPEHVKKAAESAKKALEGPEGEALRKAEEVGKQHKHK